MWEKSEVENGILIEVVDSITKVQSVLEYLAETAQENGLSTILDQCQEELSDAAQRLHPSSMDIVA